MKSENYSLREEKKKPAEVSGSYFHLVEHARLELATS